jgi:hypothetical protein
VVTADHLAGRRLSADFCRISRLPVSPWFALGHAETPLRGGGATTRCHHPNPAEAPRALAGQRSEPVRLGPPLALDLSLERSMHAQRGIIFFAATEVRILPASHIEHPRRHAFHPCLPQCHTKILATAARWQCRSSDANCDAGFALPCGLIMSVSRARGTPALCRAIDRAADQITRNREAKRRAVLAGLCPSPEPRFYRLRRNLLARAGLGYLKTQSADRMTAAAKTFDVTCMLDH